MNPEPLVTVNILSYNRRDELRHTLTKVYEQDYKNVEIIVVDNASTDGSPVMIGKEFPEVKLIKLDKNIGIAGWNKGFEAASGKYVLVLDDDSYPTKTTINKGVEFLNLNKEYSIATFNIYNIRLKESETSQYKLINPHLFHGCGTLLKKKVFNKIGGYDPSYFLYYNEMDFTIRCYSFNYKVKYLPELTIFHQALTDTNNKEIISYHTHKIKYEQYFLGHIRFLVKHFNCRYIIVYGSKWIVNRLIISFFYGYYFSFFKSALKIPIIIFNSLRLRNAVNYSIQEYYNFGNQPFIDRFYFPNFIKPIKYLKRNKQ